MKFPLLDNTFSDRRGEILFFNEHKDFLKDRTIIDIGCGTGNMADYYKDYVGLTNNINESTAGKKRGRKMIWGDAHELNDVIRASQYNKIKFDGFIMWDSLEHFVSPYIALCEARDLMPEGGRGLIFMPGQNWLSCRDHIHVMTVPQMEHLLNKVGGFDGIIHEKQYDTNEYGDSTGMAVYELIKNSEHVSYFMHEG